jgi:predicted nucleotidyltransferase
MTDKDTIQEAISRLIEAAHPSRLILFGSHATGETTEESDLDLLVIEREVSNKIHEMIRLRRALKGLDISIDLLVVSEKEAHDWGHLPGSVLYWALREGRTVYEAAH